MALNNLAVSSRKAQGLPSRVTDPVVLHRIATLLRTPEIQKRTEDKRLWKQSQPRGWVYVFRNPVTGLVKIGYSENPQRRRGELSRASGVDLELVGVRPGSFNSEAKAHARFSDLRTMYEWFTDDPRIRSWVAREEQAE